MKTSSKKLLSLLSPVLGAGVVGACPLCWIGSASLLTYLGLGALVPLWQWVVAGLLALGFLGFVLDWRAHKNFYPLGLLIIGSILLWVGRYGPLGGEGFTGWQVWGPGAFFIIAAVVYNKKQFTKQLKEEHEHV